MPVVVGLLASLLVAVLFERQATLRHVRHVRFRARAQVVGEFVGRFGPAVGWSADVWGGFEAAVARRCEQIVRDLGGRRVR